MKLSDYIKQEILNGQKHFDIGVYPDGDDLIVDKSSPNRIIFSIQDNATYTASHKEESDEE